LKNSAILARYKKTLKTLNKKQLANEPVRERFRPFEMGHWTHYFFLVFLIPDGFLYAVTA